MSTEKKRVALISVFAAIFLSGFKLVIGLLTGSLGILSEALHSILDLFAAVITYFSVRISDKPADTDHHFGHGKIENLSAFTETILLLITCIWIIYEAIKRLTSGEMQIEVNIWSYIVVISSIVINIWRTRILRITAKKYNSQALEADALHFLSDIWSSAVVLLGLICANFGYYFADPIAALLVAVIILFATYQLGKKSIEVLLDTVPRSTYNKVESAIKGIKEITNYHDLKVRTSGADTFVEVNIHVNSELSIQQAHEISHKVEEKILKIVDRCEIHVHTEPEE